MRVVVQKVHFEAANSNEKNASQATFISSSVSWKWKTSASSASIQLIQAMSTAKPAHANW